MLTPNEESVLRKLATENSPTPVQNPHAHNKQDEASESRYIGWVLRTTTRGPVSVLAGPVEGSNHPSNSEQHLNNDVTVLHRVQHALKWIKERRGTRVAERRETLSEFYARTGLGRSQILEMSKAEISRFVEIAERNNADTMAPRSTWQPEPEPVRTGATFVEVGV